jgi:hypothetical protein
MLYNCLPAYIFLENIDTTNGVPIFLGGEKLLGPNIPIGNLHRPAIEQQAFALGLIGLIGLMPQSQINCAVVNCACSEQGRFSIQMIGRA